MSGAGSARDGSGMLGGGVTYDLLSGPVWRAALKCWSLAYNVPFMSSMQRLVGTEVPVINGLRTVSMWWVMLGQSVGFMLAVGLVNPTAFFPPSGTLATWPAQVLPGAEFATDSFLALSGFLGVTSLLRATTGYVRRITPLRAAAVVAHRAWRLLPAYGVVLAVYMNLFPMASSGPFWYLTRTLMAPCARWWWTNLLFVNNLVPWGAGNLLQECMGWTFYLSLDMQLFILAAGTAIVYLAAPAAAVILVAVLTLTSLIAAGVTVNHYALSAIPAFTLPINYDYQDLYFSKPWFRAPAYLIGIAAALAWDRVRLARSHAQLQAAVPANMLGIQTFVALHAGGAARLRALRVPCTLPAALQAAALVAATAVALACVYGSWPAFSGSPDWDASTNLAYTVLSRPAWAAAVAAVLLLALSQPHNILNWIFGMPMWVPLARLTFGAYLLHPILIQLFYNSVVQYFRFSAATVTLHYLAIVTASYVAAAVLFILVERPSANLEVLVTRMLSTAWARLTRVWTTVCCARGDGSARRGADSGAGAGWRRGGGAPPPAPDDGRTPSKGRAVTFSRTEREEPLLG